MKKGKLIAGWICSVLGMLFLLIGMVQCNSFAYKAAVCSRGVSNAFNYYNDSLFPYYNSGPSDAEITVAIMFILGLILLTVGIILLVMYYKQNRQASNSSLFTLSTSRVQCAKCSNLTDSSAGSFCEHCGEKIPHNKCCLNCGNGLSNHSAFCAKCGHRA